jgi:hypothetical protein
MWQSRQASRFTSVLERSYPTIPRLKETVSQLVDSIAKTKEWLLTVRVSDAGLERAVDTVRGPASGKKSL